MNGRVYANQGITSVGNTKTKGKDCCEYDPDAIQI